MCDAKANFLEPEKVCFYWEKGVLCLKIEKEIYTKISIRRVFPLTNPHNYYSITNEQGKEIGIVHQASKLNASNREIVAAELKRVYFMPVIKKIVYVIERFGIVDWQVQTDCGTCSFTTRDLRNNTLRLAEYRLILTDVDNNRFDIPNVNLLDATSQLHIMRHT